MKLSSFLSIIATLATTAAAESKVVGPFALRVTPKGNSNCDGAFRQHPYTPL